MLAKVQGLFRLTRDAELKYTPSGMALLKMGLVCSEKYKDKETTLFIDAVAFSKPAEILNQYAGKKGTQIFLTGKLQTESWEDNNGQKRSKVSMTIEDFDFVSNKESNNNQTNNSNQGGYNQQQPQQQSYNQPNNNVPTIDVDSDFIPF